MNDTEKNKENGQDGLPQTHAAAATQRDLRTWPAILLLIVMWGLWIIPGLSGDVSMTVMMLRFMGPLACTGFVVLWWLFLSRASLMEKALGLIGLVVIVAITNQFADKSIQGFFILLFAAPWGLTGFAAALIVLARSAAPRRTWIALLVSLICFGYWTLIRIDDFRADFETTRSWRWQPTAEDLFMQELASRSRNPASKVATSTDALPTPEWPAFRGPDRDGVQSGIVLGENWDTDPPKEIWRVRVGPGWSSFSVAGDRLFTQEQRADNEAVVCYDSDSGTEIWAHEYPSRFWEVIGGVGPRGTPTLIDGQLYALGAAGILHRLNPMTGEQVWRRDINDDAGRGPPTWGFSSSPLVTDGVVIVHAGGADDKGVLAYDIESGDFRWGAPAGDHSYSSPHLSNIGGRDCVLMLTNTGLTIVDPADGTLLGQHDWPFPGFRVVQPLLVDGDSLLLGSPMGGGTRRINVQTDGDQFTTRETWTSNRFNPYFNDFVAHEGYVYGFDNNIFACVDLATGDRKWKKGRYGNGQVLLLPDGDQLLVTTEDGELVLLRATAESHQKLARHQVLNGRTWNHPVLVGNRLYVRNGEEAACFEMQSGPASANQNETTQ